MTSVAFKVSYNFSLFIDQVKQIKSDLTLLLRKLKTRNF